MRYARHGDITDAMRIRGRARRALARARPRRSRARPPRHPRQRPPPRRLARADGASARSRRSRSTRTSATRAVTSRHRRRAREARAGGEVRRRHGHGPLDRRQTSTGSARRSSPRRPCRSAPCRSTRRSSRSKQLERAHRRRICLDMIEHQAKQGVDYMTIHAGILLEHLPLVVRARHGHRQPRRLAARRVDDAPPQAEPALRALRRRARDPAAVRRHHLARRLAAAGLPSRRERPRAVRRARDAGRADEARVGEGRPGDGRRSRPHPDGPDRDERPEAEGDLPRGAVLHARSARHRHRARLRPHHERDRRGDDRLVRRRHALLRHAEGAPRPAERRGRARKA